MISKGGGPVKTVEGVMGVRIAFFLNTSDELLRQRWSGDDLRAHSTSLYNSRHLHVYRAHIRMRCPMNWNTVGG